MKLAIYFVQLRREGKINWTEHLFVLENIYPISWQS